MFLFIFPLFFVRFSLNHWEWYIDIRFFCNLVKYRIRNSWWRTFQCKLIKKSLKSLKRKIYFVICPSFWQWSSPCKQWLPCKSYMVWNRCLNWPDFRITTIKEAHITVLLYSPTYYSVFELPHWMNHAIPGLEFFFVCVCVLFSTMQPGVESWWDWYIGCALLICDARVRRTGSELRACIWSRDYNYLDV